MATSTLTKRLGHSLTLGSLALVAACSPSPKEANDYANDTLVGGRPAVAGEFPSALLIVDGCTAAKVGRRHILTAAHCVVQKTKEPALFPGKVIGISTQRSPSTELTAAAAAATSVVIEDALVHPGWKERGASVPQAETPISDVAILLITEESATAIANIPMARIDHAPVKSGDSLVVMGYGCERGLNPVDGTAEHGRRLKLQKVVALAAEQALVDNVSPTPRLGANAPGSYFFTPGVALDPNGASICPGDSGGPVYRDDGTQLTIVGVNSYYNFLGGDVNGVSYSNWHTRLDDDASEGVRQWLADTIGVDDANGQPGPAGRWIPLVPWYRDHQVKDL